MLPKPTTLDVGSASKLKTMCLILLIYVYIWYDIFVNCNWVSTRWQ